MNQRFTVTAAILCTLALPWACSSDESSPAAKSDASATGGAAGSGTGGSAGGGTGGSAGSTGGSSTTGGSAGSTGGSAGSAGSGGSAGSSGAAGSGGGDASVDAPECYFIDDPSYLYDCGSDHKILSRWYNVTSELDAGACPDFWTVDYGSDKYPDQAAALAASSCSADCPRQRSTAVMVLRCGHRDEYTSWEVNLTDAGEGGIADAGEGGACAPLYETTAGYFTDPQDWLDLPCPDE